MKPLAPRDALALVLGPAWSQNTPHTAEEASVILGATEPRHALRERLASRKAAAEGRVVLEPSPRVTPGEPMPAATMPRAQWRATWRDAEVPPLCALRERCEASGARPVIAECVDRAGLADRIPQRRRIGALWLVGTANRGYGDALEEVLCIDIGRDGDEHVPADAQRVYPGEQAIQRYDPIQWVARDWCAGLGGESYEAQRDDDPAATWQAMRVACPERVYPEPTAGESE